MSKNIKIKDETNLFDLITILLKYKLIALIFASFGIILSSWYIFSSKTIHKGVLKIRPFTSVVNYNFANINYLIEEKINFINNTKNEGTNLNVEDLKINQIFFLIEFLESFRSGRDLQLNILKENNFIKRSSLNDKEKRTLSWDMAKAYNIENIENVYKTLNNLKEVEDPYVQGFEITFTTTNKKESELILKSTFEDINKKIRKNTLNAINQIKILFSTKVDNEIRNINFILKNLRDRDVFLIQKNIKFLERQLRVAEKLNIIDDKFIFKLSDYNIYDKQTKDEFVNDNFIDLSRHTFLELNYYQKGTKTIKNQIAILKKKMIDVNANKSLKYKKFQNKLSELKANNLLNNFEIQIQKSPIFEDDFSSVSYELSSISYINTSKKIKKFLFSIFIFTTLAIIISILIGSYREHIILNNK